MLRYVANKCFDIMDAGLISRLREFLESEARSCSMDFGCVTPEYVYRIWGGAVSLEEIEYGLDKIWSRWSQGVLSLNVKRGRLWSMRWKEY